MNRYYTKWKKVLIKEGERVKVSLFSDNIYQEEKQ